MAGPAARKPRWWTGSAVAIAAAVVAVAGVLSSQRRRHEAWQAELEVHRGRMDERSTAAADRVERSFAAIYESLRTIARLPGVRRIGRHAEDFDDDARATVRELYAGLSADASVSEIYIVPRGMNPGSVDPVTGELEEPIIAFDQLIAGRGPGRRLVGEAPEPLEETEIHEYELMARQLAWFEEHALHEEEADYPALLGPEVVTCDNRWVDASNPRDEDRSGLVYSTPFYGRDGELKGCVSAVILTRALRETAGEISGGVRCGSYFATALGGIPESSASYAHAGQPDPSLLYSRVRPLQIRDEWGRWEFWSCVPDERYWLRPGVKAARDGARLGVAASVLAGGLILWAGWAVRRREAAVGEARLLRMVEAMPVMARLAGRDGRCTEFNAGWLAFTGRGREEEQGEGWLAGVHPEDRARCAAELREAAGARRPFEMRYRLRRGDGEHRLVEDRWAPRVGPSGEFEGYASACLDVTEREAAGESVRRGEARVRAIIDTALDAVVSMDGGGVVTGWNRQAEHTFGWTAAEAVGRVMGDLIVPPELRELHRAGLARYVGGGAPKVVGRRIEVPALRKDGGRITVELAINPITVDGRVVFSAFLRDISERKRAESHQAASLALSARLSAAATVQEAARAVNDALAAMAGAERSAVLLFGADGVCRFVGWRGLSREYRQAVEGHCPWPRNAREAHTIVVHDVLKDGSLAPFHELMRCERIGTAAFVPVMTDEGVAGKLMLYEETPGTLTPERLASALSAGAYLGLAVGRLAASERQAAAHAEMRRLAQAIDAHADAVFLTDAEARVTRVNPAFVRMTGFDPEHVLGRTPSVFKSVRTDPAVYAELWRTIQAGRPWAGRLCNRRRRPDGEADHFWVDSSITPIMGPGGSIDGYVAVQRDVSATVAAETRERARLAGAEALARAARALGGPGGLEERAGQALRELAAVPGFGGPGAVYLRDEETGELRDLVTLGAGQVGKTDAEGWLRRSAQEGRPAPTPDASGVWWAAPFTNRADGACLGGLLLRASSGDDGERRGLLAEAGAMLATAVLQDRAARLAELARARAEEASRSKSEFLANMSHEIRTPMTAILGYTQLLAEDGDADAAPKRRLEYIETVKRNGDHLMALINDILDLSKIEAGRMTVERIAMSPEQMLREVESMMLVKARQRGITLEVDLSTPLPPSIESDPVRLKQILVNLVGNAIKFTERGGVTVRAGVGGSARLRLEVIDTGIGMNAEQVERLFAAFTQADASMTRRFGGTGLGLRISRSLANLLGGDISVESEPGRGSRFIVEVDAGPAEPAAAGTIRPAARPMLGEGRPVGARPLAGVRVLLAEDGEDNRRLITFHLRKAGAEVSVFENGRRALEALCVGGDASGPLLGPPPFDVVVTDMQMPEMDGYTLASTLRRKGWRGRIVALTAHAMSGDEARCLAAGCDVYSSKPIEREKLIALCLPAAEAA